MKSKDTLNDFKNQLARQQMEAEVAMGVRRLSYEDFKRKTRAHQIEFRENEMEVGFDTFPNVLPESKARKGLIFFKGFREEIMAELKKPVAPTSTHYSGQMLTNLLRSEHIPYNIFFPMKKDLEGTKRLFNKILGKEEISSIEDIKIEYHPIPIQEYLDDHTSFDVYVPYRNQSNQRCGIGIEVKSTEKEYPLKPGTAEYKHVKDASGRTCLSGPYLDVTWRCGYISPMLPTRRLLPTNSVRSGATTSWVPQWYFMATLSHSPALYCSPKRTCISAWTPCPSIRKNSQTIITTPVCPFHTKTCLI